MKSAYLVIFILLTIAGCIEKQDKVNLSIVQEPGVRENDTAVKVAIASVVSPKESYAYYEEMIQYISQTLGGPVKTVQRRSYQEINQLIQNNEIDVAFICGGAYIDDDGKTTPGLKLLVAPQEFLHLQRVIGERFGGGVDGRQSAPDHHHGEPNLQVGDRVHLGRAG